MISIDLDLKLCRKWEDQVHALLTQGVAYLSNHVRTIHVVVLVYLSPLKFNLTRFYN